LQRKAELEKQLKVLFDYDKPQDTLFCGATTNPRLTRKVLELIPDDVNPVIDKLIKENPYKSSYELAWLTYKSITEMGTQLYMPLFEKSKYEKGYVSAQVDPRLVTDVKEMLLRRHPKSLKVCALIDKRARREIEFEGDYVGFTIEDGFVVGYGIDHAERHRNLPEIFVVEKD